MRRVGTVVRSAQGLAIVQSPNESHPEIGENVVNEQLDQVGRVVDVMGPTDRPYVVVRPSGEMAPATLLDTKLYIR